MDGKNYNWNNFLYLALKICPLTQSYNPKFDCIILISAMLNMLICIITYDIKLNTNNHVIIAETISNPTIRPTWEHLSHTWVRYPGFSGHGVKCPILTTVVPGFSGDLIGCTIRSKWGPFGDLHLARKKSSLCENKLFLGEIKFSQRRTRPVKSLWCQIVPMQESTNE